MGRIKERSAENFLQLQADNVERLGIYKVGLGNDRQTTLNLKQAADVEVLDSLRLDGLVRRDDQQDQINAAHAGQHVAHEELVPGDVHESQAQQVAIAREFEVREAEINGDAAPLFLLQPVGINAGERAHQRALSVINVTRSFYDYGLHREPPFRFKSSLAPLGISPAGSRFAALRAAPLTPVNRLNFP